MRRLALLALVLVGLGATGLSGCGGDDDAPDRGSIVVVVTLSRAGPPGPNIDHVPQPGVEVTATNGSAHSWSAETDEAGEAHLSLPVGDYDVDTTFCPDGPQKVRITKDAVSTVRVDCVAA